MVVCEGLDEKWGIQVGGVGKEAGWPLREGAQVLYGRAPAATKNEVMD